MTPRRSLTSLALLAVLLGAGCTSVKPFVYRPVATRAAAPVAPARLAVLPFEDATEDYVKKGGYLEPEKLWWNLARGGVPTVFEPVTAPLWAQAFARELEASGRFGAVRYCVDATELKGEDVVVSGVLLRADEAASWKQEDRYEFKAVATRRKDGRRVWERSVSRSLPGKEGAYDCGAFGISCWVERRHEDFRQVLAGMFEEAGADLARTLAGKPAAEPGPAGTPASPEPVDDTIRKILEGR